MINALIGTKIDQSQSFLEDGTRIPVTTVQVSGNVVVMVKDTKKHGYSAVQLGFGARKRPNKAQAGIAKAAKLQSSPLFFKEVQLTPDTTEEQLPKIGDTINPQDVLKPGDIINVTGVSKGKGFAGVVKRHNFRGGPRTHGQSDRERAPGSIGQTTTPGRVYKGKRMAGRMGSEQKTIRNLTVLAVSDQEVVLSGLIPGIKKGLVVIKKVKESKKFVPLYKETKEIQGTEETQVKQEEK